MKHSPERPRSGAQYWRKEPPIDEPLPLRSGDASARVLRVQAALGHQPCASTLKILSIDVRVTHKSPVGGGTTAPDRAWRHAETDARNVTWTYKRGYGARRNTSAAGTAGRGPGSGSLLPWANKLTTLLTLSSGDRWRGRRVQTRQQKLFDQTERSTPCTQVMNRYSRQGWPGGWTWARIWKFQREATGKRRLRTLFSSFKSGHPGHIFMLDTRPAQDLRRCLRASHLPSFHRWQATPSILAVTKL